MAITKRRSRNLAGIIRQDSYGAWYAFAEGRWIPSTPDTLVVPATTPMTPCALRVIYRSCHGTHLPPRHLLPRSRRHRRPRQPVRRRIRRLAHRSQLSLRRREQLVLHAQRNQGRVAAYQPARISIGVRAYRRRIRHAVVHPRLDRSPARRHPRQPRLTLPRRFAAPLAFGRIV